MSLLTVRDSRADFNAYLAFRRGIEELLDPRRYTIGWLDAEIMSGGVKVWAGENACLLTKLDHYPTGAMDIHGLAAVGDLEEIVTRLIPAAEGWGREQGCIGALAESREGWERVLRHRGYRPWQRSVRKDLA